VLPSTVTAILNPMHSNERPAQPESNESNIVLRNEPRLSEHEVDQERNELKQELVPGIQEFVAVHPLTKGTEAQVTFFHTGVSSLVCKIETDSIQLVLKISLRAQPIQESVFLEAWSEAGVNVPQTHEEGEIKGQQYSLLEYVDEPALDELYTPEQLVEEKVYFEMGSTLKDMHEPNTQGFGRPNGEAGQYETFTEWLTTGEDIQEALQYVQSNNLYPSHADRIKQSIEVLLQGIGDESASSYCHDDYTPSNIFATHPITVFDPNPKYNNGLIDLGRSLTAIINSGYESSLVDKAMEQMVGGYFDNESYDKETVVAAIVLGIVWKSPYPHRTGDLDSISIFNQYLNELE